MTWCNSVTMDSNSPLTPKALHAPGVVRTIYIPLTRTAQQWTCVRMRVHASLAHLSFTTLSCTCKSHLCCTASCMRWPADQATSLHLPDRCCPPQAAQLLLHACVTTGESAPG
jgi:hypothetical protein